LSVDDIDVVPLAAESMGVRSLCTKITTPDVTILLDPSAALAFRMRLEPHPMEYEALLKSLERIFVASREADIISISHYHYDHVRPGFTNFRYNFSSLEDLRRIFEGKRVYAKDYRENINPSQRRRGFFFLKDVKDVVDTITWSDNTDVTIGDTRLVFSPPFHHGPKDSRLGYVVSTMIEYDNQRVIFVPDVQGPVVKNTLEYLLNMEPHLIIVGGPPLYIQKFSDANRLKAKESLTKLAKNIHQVVVDHHLLRSEEWISWLKPIRDISTNMNNEVLTMAELLGQENTCLESERSHIYQEFPPSEKFLNWANSTDEFKMKNMPPIR
jgi:predicted metallo-beta-lactamase superfamily hydrolase